MLLTSRPATFDDFEAFFPAFYERDRDNADLRAQVEHEWRVFLQNPSAISILVEDAAPPVLDYEAQARPSGASRREDSESVRRNWPGRMVGFGQFVFVSPAFVAHVRSGSEPWILRQASRTLPDGSWPLLCPDAVRAANSGDGLDVLITRWAIARTRLTDEQQPRAGEFLWRAFQHVSRGYRFREILVETIGDLPRRMAQNSGFFLRADYPGLFDDAPPHSRPCLCGLTRPEARQNPGTLMGHLFTYHPPRFLFTPLEQDLLQWALTGGTDGGFARAREMTENAVKKRWLQIYRRVTAKDGALLPMEEGRGKTRGPEKRACLLHHLREHPEELRPHRAKSGKVREAGSTPARRVSA